MQRGISSLATARWIATLMYVVPLVVFQFVGKAVELEMELEPDVLKILFGVLVVVGIVDYGVSLGIERFLLAKARANQANRPEPVVTAALVVSALGVSLAVYGLVLTLMGAPAWGAAFYVLCAGHGLHLMLRWPAYVAAAEGAPH